jgi:phosphoenolpyruvate phosphomutase
MTDIQPKKTQSNGIRMQKDKLSQKKRTRKFRELLHRPSLDFLLEAHNGISAKIVEESGFEAIWAGGLALSAQFGVRDSNEASWTQVLEMLEFMSDAVEIPILLDGDTGYGNFNNVRRLVRKLEQRDIVGVCIEDKLFPKTNSFINGKRQKLADIDEFCGRIKAGKDAQRDDDFTIITRVEAFIAGWGLNEALERASAYHEAGADGILIHSALSHAAEVLTFKREWGDRCPVIIVPTKYYPTPTEVFDQAGFSIVIWANHLLRASVSSMQACAKKIHSDGGLHAIEDQIVPVQEIFRLQGVAELQRAESQFLPQHSVRRPQVVVLAASRGVELGEITANVPKAMIKIGSKPLLQHIVDTYRRAGLNEINVVTGYRPDTVAVDGATCMNNPDFAETGELISLAIALDSLTSDDEHLYVSYGDVLFKRYIVDLLADSDAPVTIIVDADWKFSSNLGREADYVSCSEPHTRSSFCRRITLLDIAEDLPERAIDGEWMGFIKVSAEALPGFRAVLSSMREDPRFRKAKLHDLLKQLLDRGETIRVIYTKGHWLDIDGVEDIVHASSFT